MLHITAAQFTDRFPALVMVGWELPQKHLDRHLVLISACLKVEPDRLYSEPEINEAKQTRELKKQLYLNQKLT